MVHATNCSAWKAADPMQCSQAALGSLLSTPSRLKRLQIDTRPPSAMDAPQAVVAELQQVLLTASEALDAQEQGREQDAVQKYFLARSRVRYTLEALLRPLAEQLPGDATLEVAAAACSLLEETYSGAIERLTHCGSGSGRGRGAEGFSDDSEDAEGTQQPQPSGAARSADAGQLEALRGAGGGGSRQQQQRLSALAQRCLREVQGSLDEVMGLEAIKQELREVVLLPMSFPHLFTGIRRPQCNLIFHGAPGTGKTMLVEKLAAEADTPLLCISPSAILSKWAGESEKTLRAVFEAAAMLSPAIIFIDEVDSLAPARSSGDDLAARRVLTELLVQMTAMTNRPGCLVFVLAATNRVQDCDPALLRRFDRKIEVPPPSTAARAAFFSTTVARPEIASALSDEDIAQLAAATEGCTGSDLAVLCRQAAMAPLRAAMVDGTLQLAQQEGRLDISLRPVRFEDFVEAISKLDPAPCQPAS